jgi:hypothetical protein
MKQLLKLVGFLLLLIFLLWPIYLYWNNELDATANHRFRAFGEDLTGINAISVEQVKTVFSNVEKTISNKNHAGAIFAISSKAADWIAFGLTAIITLISGYYGRPAKNGDTQPAQPDDIPKPAPVKGSADIATERKRAGLVRVIGLIAALSSVAVALSGRFQASSENSFKQADDLTSSLQLARRDLTSDKTAPLEATDILKKLEAIRERNE